MSESPSYSNNLPSDPNARGQSLAIAGDERPVTEPHGTALTARRAAIPIIQLPAGSIRALSAFLPKKRSQVFKAIWFAAAVVMPAALAAVYYLLIASSQYVSEFRCVVRSANSERNESAQLFQGNAANSAIGVESNVVVQYIKSGEIVDALDKQINLRGIYSSTQADWLSRLGSAVQAESLVEYWNRMVEPFFDMTTGTITVQVKAFTPQDAQRIANAIIPLSENLVDNMSRRARDDAVRLDEEEVSRAADRLRQARQAVLDFRNREQMLDPKKEADSSLNLIAKLEEDLALAKTQLGSYESSASAAPAVQVLSDRIRALGEQIAAAKSTLTTANPQATNSVLSQGLGGFEALDTDQQLAEKYYDSTLSILEQARADADRRMSYLAVFVAPNLPEEALYPKRLRSVLLVSLGGFGLWLVGIIALHSVREHV
jgi:capsular polysaccharide transport system permease protein